MVEARNVSRFRTFLGTLLVGGTAIGAGMLALPVATAEGGLIPSWLVYFLCWIFSMATGILFVEIGLWLPKGANIAGMAKQILGPMGKLVAWILYLFLFYCLTIAYVSGGGRLVTEFFGGNIPYAAGLILFTLFFGTFVYLGTKVAGRINGVLMMGLIMAYLVFLVIGAQKVTSGDFHFLGWKSALLGLPVIFTSFSYQGTVPSLLDYLGRDPKKMRFAIIMGTSIPFIAYVLWDFIIKGIIPIYGPNSLLEAKMLGVSAVDPLQHIFPNSPIYVFGNFFAFFALTTSFIGVTLGLTDFLADAMHVKNTGVSRLGLCVLIFLPSMAISLINPSLFLRALGYAGGFGCALLLGLMPVVMVWVGRYNKRYKAIDGHLFGGKWMLSLLALFVVFEVIIEVALELGLVS